MANIAVDASSGTIVGTSGSDSFTGVKGNFIIWGAQTLVGGAGDDFYAVSGMDIKVSEAANGGNDTILSLNTYVLPDNIENLQVWGSSTAVGNDLDNRIQGSAEIIGGKGNDVLIGGPDSQYQFGAQSGHDIITNWATTAIIRLGYSQYSSFADVQKVMVQDGSDVVINLDATDSIRVQNTHLSDFTAANFQLTLDTGKVGAMTFRDEFNTLSTGVRYSGVGTWDTEYDGGATTNTLEGRTLGGNHEQQIYVDSAFTGKNNSALGLNPFSIDNGVLTITEAPTPSAVKDAAYGYQYTSGVLTTKESFAQTYGYFEAKMELPAGSGVWPAFWLMRKDGTWPPELDVMEAWGSDAHGGTTAVGTLHTAESGSHTSSSSGNYLSDATTAMHTYGIMWTPETLTWYIDGVEYKSMPTPADMHDPMYMIVNLAVSPGNTDPNLTSQLKVDYVRAYSLTDVPTIATGRAALWSGTDYTGSMPTMRDGFNTAFYAAHNLDVVAAGVDPFAHYEQSGKGEGRLGFDPNGDKAGTADAYYTTIMAATGNASLRATVSHDTYQFAPGFGTDTITGFDVANDRINVAGLVAKYGAPTITALADGTGAALHWAGGETIDLIGLSTADAAAVLKAAPYAAVAAAQPGFGKVIGVEDGFNTAYYAAHNPDVVAAHMDLLKHYELYGKAEGRLGYDPAAPVIDLAALNVAATTGSRNIPSGAGDLVTVPQSQSSVSVSKADPTPTVQTASNAAVNPQPTAVDTASPTVTAPTTVAAVPAAPAHANWGAVTGVQDGFNAAYYAAHNLDVVASGMDLLAHYEQYGKTEGRAGYDPNGAAADTATASYLYVGTTSGSATLTASAGKDTFLLPAGFTTETIKGFDVAHDTLNVADLIAKYGNPTFTDMTGGTGTEVHWSSGATLDLLGLSNVDAQQAVLGNATTPASTAPTTAAAAAAPAHANWGAVTGVQDGFNAAYYAAHNLDVVASGMDLLAHYEQYGKTEGRAGYDPNGAAADTTTASYLYVGTTSGSATLTASAGKDTFLLPAGFTTETIKGFDVAHDTLNVADLIAKYGNPTFTDMTGGTGTEVHWSHGETVQLLGVSNADAHHAVLG